MATPVALAGGVRGVVACHDPLLRPQPPRPGRRAGGGQVWKSNGCVPLGKRRLTDLPGQVRHARRPHGRPADGHRRRRAAARDIAMKAMSAQRSPPRTSSFPTSMVRGAFSSPRPFITVTTCSSWSPRRRLPGSAAGSASPRAESSQPRRWATSAAYPGRVLPASRSSIASAQQLSCNRGRRHARARRALPGTNAPARG